MTRSAIYRLIDDERTRQQSKWGGQHAWGTGDCSSQHVHPIVKSAVLMEEAGEVARAILDRDSADLKTELVQVAAVAVAWLESLGGV